MKIVSEKVVNRLRPFKMFYYRGIDRSFEHCKNRSILQNFYVIICESEVFTLSRCNRMDGVYFIV